MAEVVEDRKQGFVVEIGDTALIKKYIEEIYNNKDLYKELSFNARKRFEDNYSVENYYNRLMKTNND